MPRTCYVLCVIAETDSTVRRRGHVERVSEQVAGVLGKAPATLPELLVSPGKAEQHL